MKVKIIHNPLEVEEFLQVQSRYNYIYQFSNLSNAEWRNIICYGLYEATELKQIAMVLINERIPVLLAASFLNTKYNAELLLKIKDYLPKLFYTHIDQATLKQVFSSSQISELEQYVNMGLCSPQFDQMGEQQVVCLGYNELGMIKKLLEVSYPEAWLDEELVKLEKNYGINIGDKLVSFAGIHAYSEKYQVAAVAHVTTHPDYRRKGYTERVLSALLNDLKQSIEYIGLNVRVNNFAARQCYKKLGFEEFGEFVACVVNLS